MLIRDWCTADLITVYQLNQLNQPHLNALSIEQLTQLATQAAYFRIIEIDTRLAGFVLALYPSADYGSENLAWFNQRYQNFLYIDRIAIADFAQNRGCGAKLYKDVESFCRSRAISTITLEVNIRPRNQGSIDFHKKMRFVEVGRQDTGGGVKTVALMGKEIDP